MAKKITEHKVRQLVGKATRYRISEDNLQLEVNPSGRRVWYAQGRANGKRFRKRLGDYPVLSVKDARGAVRKLLTERDEGTRIIDDPQSFAAFVEGDFADWCLAARKQGKETLQRIRYTHLPIFADRKLRAITKRDIEQHKAKLLRAKANATVKRDLGDIRRVFSKAVEWGRLRTSPAEDVSDPKVEHAEKLYLTEEEVARLTAALEEWEKLAHKEWLCKIVGNADTETETPYSFSPTERRRYIHHPDLPKLIRLLVNTGLRKNEALSLCWTDINVDEDTPTLTVRPEIAKSGRRRVIPINEKLVDTLLPSMGLSGKEARAHHREQIKFRNGAAIFVLQHPSKAWRKFRAMADLEHITLHHLRHNFASQLVLRGAAPSVIQRLMGHTSIETTMLYFSVRKEDAIEAVNLL